MASFVFNANSLTDYTWDNDRFIKVRMRIMHAGTNTNGTHFSFDAIEGAKDSLRNTPILAHMLIDEANKELDAGSHDYRFVEDIFKGGYRKYYDEAIIGIIPETNNYAIEEYKGKFYVCCDGYIFRGYSNYAEYFVEDNLETTISMEIDADDFNTMPDGQTIDIPNFKYKGITVLGNDKTPGMQNASFAKYEDLLFESEEDRQKHLMETYESLRKAIGSEKGDNMSKKKDGLEFEEEVEVDETVNDNPEEFEAENENEEVNNEEFEAETEDEVEDVPTEYVKEYKLSHDDIRSQLYGKLNEMMGYGDEWFYIEKVYDDYFIFEAPDGKDYKVSYFKENDNVILGESAEEVTSQYLTADETAKLEALRTNYEAISQEVVELREYKADVETKEEQAKVLEFRNSKIEYMNENFNYIPEESFNEFVEKIDEYESVDQLKSDLCVYVVTNNISRKEYSATKKNDRNVKNIITEPSANKVGYYGELSAKK